MLDVGFWMFDFWVRGCGAGFPLEFFCPLFGGGEDVCEVAEVEEQLCGAVEWAACFGGDGDG